MLSPPIHRVRYLLARGSDGCAFHCIEAITTAAMAASVEAVTANRDQTPREQVRAAIRAAVRRKEITAAVWPEESTDALRHRPRGISALVLRVATVDIGAGLVDAHFDPDSRWPAAGPHPPPKICRAHTKRILP